jgi:hypothetical protein
LKDNNYTASLIQREKLVQESITLEMKLDELDKIAKTVVNISIKNEN